MLEYLKLVIIVSIIPVFVISGFVSSKVNSSKPFLSIVKLFFRGILSCIPACILEMIFVQYYGNSPKDLISLFIYTFFGIGLIIDAFFVYGMVTNSDMEAVFRYGMYIALISIIVLHLTISYSDFCVLKQMRLGEYKVMVGTLIEKRKVPGYRTKINIFTIRDDDGVDRVYQGIPKGEYDEAEPGRRCMIFKFNKDKSNTAANITKHVVLM